MTRTHYGGQNGRHDKRAAGLVESGRKHSAQAAFEAPIARTGSEIIATREGNNARILG